MYGGNARFPCDSTAFYLRVQRVATGESTVLATAYSDSGTNQRVGGIGSVVKVAGRHLAISGSNILQVDVGGRLTTPQVLGPQS